MLSLSTVSSSRSATSTTSLFLVRRGTLRSLQALLNRWRYHCSGIRVLDMQNKMVLWSNNWMYYRRWVFVPPRSMKNFHTLKCRENCLIMSAQDFCSTSNNYGIYVVMIAMGVAGNERWRHFMPYMFSFGALVVAFVVLVAKISWMSLGLRPS